MQTLQTEFYMHVIVTLMRQILRFTCLRAFSSFLFTETMRNPSPTTQFLTYSWTYYITRSLPFPTFFASFCIVTSLSAEQESLHLLYSASHKEKTEVKLFVQLESDEDDDWMNGTEREGKEMILIDCFMVQLTYIYNWYVYTHIIFTYTYAYTHTYIYLRITYTYTYTNTYIYIHAYIHNYIYITVYDMCSWVYKPTFTLIVVTQCAVARWVRRPKSWWSWWPTQALAPSPPAWPRREGLMAGFTMFFSAWKMGNKWGWRGQTSGDHMALSCFF